MCSRLQACTQAVPCDCCVMNRDIGHQMLASGKWGGSTVVAAGSSWSGCGHTAVGSGKISVHSSWCRCTGALAQLFSAGVALEDVSLQTLGGVSELLELLAALAPAAGTLKSLYANDAGRMSNVRPGNQVLTTSCSMPGIGHRA